MGEWREQNANTIHRLLKKVLKKDGQKVKINEKSVISTKTFIHSLLSFDHDYF
jgi:hypothetical protein